VFGDIAPHFDIFLRSGDIAPRSGMSLGYILHSGISLSFTSVQNMESEAPALPELECVAALPVFPREAPQENEAVSFWIVEDTNDLDESGVCHKNAFYVLLNEWFRGRDYTCTLLTKWKYTEILQFCLDLMEGADPRLCLLLGTSKHTSGRQSMMLLL